MKFVQNKQLSVIIANCSLLVNFDIPFFTHIFYVLLIRLTMTTGINQCFNYHVVVTGNIAMLHGIFFNNMEGGVTRI